MEREPHSRNSPISTIHAMLMQVGSLQSAGKAFVASTSCNSALCVVFCWHGLSKKSSKCQLIAVDAILSLMAKYTLSRIFS